LTYLHTCFHYAVDLISRGQPNPKGKILIIGGGIANFTNVAATFKGIIRALKEYKNPLINHQVKIFVRRGGPNYQEGLKAMRLLGESLGVPIKVFGPETHITEIVPLALGISKGSSGGGHHIQKFYWGTKETLLPVYTSVKEAVQKHPDADVVVNFASSRSVYSSTLDILSYPRIKVVALIAEGVPERHAREILHLAKAKNVLIIGPATVGGIKPGCFRIGNSGG